MDFKEFLSWIPGWLGFLLLIIVGVAMAIHGFFDPLGVGLGYNARLGFADFGLCAALVGAASWIMGGTSKIAGRAGKVGIKVKISDLPWWGYLVDIVLIVIAVVLFLALKA